MSDFPPQSNNPERSSQAPLDQYSRTAKYIPTKEEERVLSECSTEATYQRALPLSILFGIGALKGVKSGYLQVLSVPSSLQPSILRICVSNKIHNKFYYLIESWSTRTMAKCVWF